MSRSVLWVAVALMVSSCCPFGVWHVRTYVANYEDEGYGNPPPAFQVGDTVQFIAEEELFEATCRTAALPSDRDPDEYEWRPSDSSIESLGNGLVKMAVVGEFRLTVSTSHAEDVITGRIVQRVADVRLTPANVVLRVGDTVSFLVEALDGDGEVIRELDRSSGLQLLEGEPSDPANPIAANQADSDGIHFIWRAYRPGVVELRARLAVYGTEQIVALDTLVVLPAQLPENLNQPSNKPETAPYAECTSSIAA